jgi:hypothetical protein
MRAVAVDLGREKDTEGPIGLLYAPTLDRRPKRALTFAEAGLSFIELREQHLRFMSAIYGRWVPPLEECTGRTLVDDKYLPVGSVVGSSRAWRCALVDGPLWQVAAGISGRLPALDQGGVRCARSSMRMRSAPSSALNAAPTPCPRQR